MIAVLSEPVIGADAPLEGERPSSSLCHSLEHVKAKVQARGRLTVSSYAAGSGEGQSSHLLFLEIFLCSRRRSPSPGPWSLWAAPEGRPSKAEESISIRLAVLIELEPPPSYYGLSTP